MKTQKVTVKTNEENPEPVEIIADAIIKISEAFESMKNSRLTQRALLLLIQDNCGMVGGRHNKKKPTAKQIQEVLDSVTSLKKAYIKQPIKK